MGYVSNMLAFSTLWNISLFKLLGATFCRGFDRFFIMLVDLILMGALRLGALGGREVNYGA